MAFHVPEQRFAFLSGKVALVVGIANEHSIAYGCARALREAGARRDDEVARRIAAASS